MIKAEQGGSMYDFVSECVIVVGRHSPLNIRGNS